MDIQVNRKTLNLTIRFEIDTDEGIEVAYLHAAPLDNSLISEFTSDLAGSMAAVINGNPLLVACEYLGMVEAHISETREPNDAVARIARLNKILLAEVCGKGAIVSSFTEYKPISVGEAIEAGIVTTDELEMLVSKYLFFSRALRVSRSLVMQFAGSRLNASDFGLEQSLLNQSAELNSSSPAPSVSEISAEKVTQSSIEPLTDLQDSPPVSSPAKTQRKIRATGPGFGS